MRCSPSLWRSWSPDTTVLYPLHTFQLWNNAALYEWSTVRKVGGMALKWLRPGRNTVLHYQRPPALHHCVFPPGLPRVDVSRSASPAPNIHNVRRQECSAAAALTKTCDPHLENVNSGDPAHSKTILFIYKLYQTKLKCSKSNPDIIQSSQESTRAFVNPAMLLLQASGPQLYLCQPGHHWSKVKKERSVPFMSSVQYNGTLWSESHWEQSLFRKHSAHSACLAMGQCNDTLLSPYRLGFINRAGIKNKKKHKCSFLYIVY